MPAFIKTPADEKRWAEAKQAASKTLSESDGDSYWKLTNSIYQKMSKAEDLGKNIRDFFEFTRSSTDESSIDELKTFLEKARRRMSDEVSDDDEEEPSLEEQGFREIDPDTENDEAEKWLAEHDKGEETSDEEPSDEDEEYSEYGPDEDEESHQQVAPQAGQPELQSSPAQEVPQEAKEEVKGEGRFPQPTKEDIAHMRQYTRPWEQRARDKSRLEAEAHKNPVLHHEGRLLEARNTAHKSRQDAYEQFQASPEYQNADPITQMEMDAKFHSDWHEKNPEHLSNAVKLHGEAHKKGMGAKDIHAAAKDEQIRHILSGGAQPESPMSVEEAMQHAGGAKGEEGTTGSIAQDRASSFAAGNKDFISQYAKDYEKKGKKPKDISDMMNYDEGSRADVARVLGEHPALKDPKKKAQVDAFFEKYHPLIAMNAHKVLNKLGLDHKKGDVDLGMLHEAGMHGLMQAINDYDHEHPSKASFSTHAGNKIRGLQQTALRGQDQIPQELRVGAKKFGQPAAPKRDISAVVSKHGPEVADRMKRIQTFRQVHVPKPKPPKTEGGGEL